MTWKADWERDRPYTAGFTGVPYMDAVPIYVSSKDGVLIHYRWVLLT